MITLNHIIFYEPDDDTFCGDRVRTEIHINDEPKMCFHGDRGDTYVDAIFYGYVKAFRHVYGDEEVEVKFTKMCCIDWDYLEEDWSEDEDIRLGNLP